MEYKDYYKILGVEKNATDKQIKSAFRKLARQCHPDLNPNDPKAEARFKDVNEAYEVLSDAEKRAKYDQLGADWQRWQHSGGQSGDFDWGRWAAAPGGQRVHVQYGTAEDFADLFGEGSPFSDFFTSIFGGVGGRTQRAGGRPGQAMRGDYQYQTRMQMGQDLEQEVEISLAEAYHGTTRVLSKDGRRLEVRIPPGARSGTRVRVRGEGTTAISGGAAGDLYLRIKVASDARFERSDDDLRMTAPVDLYTAVLGGEVPVATMSGEVKLKIPGGSQNGQTFRLRGKGMPKIKATGEHGDLYVRLEVRLPTDLTAKQRALFEELRRMS
jgi:curved DNA-binding protein